MKRVEFGRAVEQGALGTRDVRHVFRTDGAVLTPRGREPATTSEPLIEELAIGCVGRLDFVHRDAVLVVFDDQPGHVLRNAVRDEVEPDLGSGDAALAPGNVEAVELPEALGIETKADPTDVLQRQVAEEHVGDLRVVAMEVGAVDEVAVEEHHRLESPPGHREILARPEMLAACGAQDQIALVDQFTALRPAHRNLGQEHSIDEEAEVALSVLFLHQFGEREELRLGHTVEEIDRLTRDPTQPGAETERDEAEQTDDEQGAGQDVGDAVHPPDEGPESSQVHECQHEEDRHREDHEASRGPGGRLHQLHAEPVEELGAGDGPVEVGEPVEQALQPGEEVARHAAEASRRPERIGSAGRAEQEAHDRQAPQQRQPEERERGRDLPGDVVTDEVRDLVVVEIAQPGDDVVDVEVAHEALHPSRLGCDRHAGAQGQLGFEQPELPVTALSAGLEAEVEQAALAAPRDPVVEFAGAVEQRRVLGVANGVAEEDDVLVEQPGVAFDQAIGGPRQEEEESEQSQERSNEAQGADQADHAKIAQERVPEGIEAGEQSEGQRRQELGEEVAAEVAQPLRAEDQPHEEIGEQDDTDRGVGPGGPADPPLRHGVAEVVDDDQADHRHDQPEDHHLPDPHQARAEDAVEADREDAVGQGVAQARTGPAQLQLDPPHREESLLLFLGPGRRRGLAGHGGLRLLASLSEGPVDLDPVLPQPLQGLDPTQAGALGPAGPGLVQLAGEPEDGGACLGEFVLVRDTAHPVDEEGLQAFLLPLGLDSEVVQPQTEFIASLIGAIMEIGRDPTQSARETEEPGNAVAVARGLDDRGMNQIFMVEMRI